MATQNIDVAELLDGLKLGRLHVLVFTLCFIALFLDGMDFGTVLVAAPAILRDWHLQQNAMGIVFGAGNFGLLIGAVIFGKIGDRYGRRVGIIAGVLTYSLPALVTGFAGDINQLLVLRCLTALGIGGVVPNAIALLNETAPKKYRASFVIVSLIGNSLGAAGVGGLAAATIPHYGWPAVFIIVGALGLVLSLLLYAALPESIRYLTLAAPASPRLRRMIGHVAPGIAPDAGFHLEQQKKVAKFNIGILFRGRLGAATPLLWCAYFFEALTFFTILSWSVVLLQNNGVSPAMASLAFAYGGLGSILAHLILARLVDKFGATVIALSGLLAIVALFCLGSLGLSTTMTVAMMILVITVSAGTHDSLNGIVASFYPTAIRGNGVGYASGFGRLGAIPGPVIGGFLLSAGLPFSTVMNIIAIPYVLLVIVCFMLARRRPSENDEPAIAPAE
ncbi:MAG TPA: MFS transporter [Stellaceae bacterium]|nr:MFS transporter [Stellaceae bacterium]